MPHRFRALPVAFTAALAAGCGDSEMPPPPAELTRDAVGPYCGMIVADHAGPKGQIFIEGISEPLWFSSVRDAVAFTMLPEEPKRIAAIYVNDMGRASWEAPEPGTWIEARDAWYTIETGRTGGMGAPEAVPFADRPAAEAFAAAHGGRVAAFDDIPQAFILGAPAGAAAHDSVQSHNNVQ